MTGEFHENIKEFYKQYHPIYKFWRLRESVFINLFKTKAEHAYKSVSKIKAQVEEALEASPFHFSLQREDAAKIVLSSLIFLSSLVRK